MTDFYCFNNFVVVKQLTEDIENALGTVLATTKTSEFFEVSQKVTESLDVNVGDGSESPKQSGQWSNW